MEIKEITSQNCKYLIQTPPGRDLPAALSPATALRVRAFHRQLPGYKPTPLVRLERLGRAWGFNDIFVKDEAPRFGLKILKVLGGSYAVALFSVYPGWEDLNPCHNQTLPKLRSWPRVTNPI